MECEQELCPFWDGHACPCSVLNITESEREEQRRAIGC